MRSSTAIIYATTIPCLSDICKLSAIADLLHSLGYAPRKSKLSVALLGAINGLLPCGLTSIALASCLTLDRVVDGFSFMLLFGAGTLPAMLGLTRIVAWFARKHLLSTQALMTVLLILSGCVLIIRVLVMTHPPSGTGSGFAEILCK
jgi:sulfite exporter TauE/SafE